MSFDPEYIDPTEVGVVRISTLMTAAERAYMYAQAVKATAQCQQALTDAYGNWREETGNHERIERGSTQWETMMEATARQYRQLQNAKARERRAKKRLVDYVIGGAA